MSSSNPLGTPFLELLTVDSTNNYAMGLVRASMAQHGTAVFAREQFSGKGQRNKHWISSPGQNIAISLIVEPQRLLSQELFMLSMTMAVGSLRFLAKYLPEGITIKWPNDLFWCDRKAGGILIENMWQGDHWKYAVVGIGININQADFGILGPRAVSLKQITGHTFNPVLLAKELCVSLNEAFNETIENPETIRSYYRSHLYQLNKHVKLKKGNRVFEALIKDVTKDGQLVVWHGTEENYNVGEVEWVI